MAVIGPSQLHSSSRLILSTVSPGFVKQLRQPSSITRNNQKAVLRIWTLQHELQPVHGLRDPDMTLATISYIEEPLYEIIALEATW